MEQVNEKKSNKGLIVTIVILVLLCLGLGGYLTYDKVLRDTDNKKDNKQVDNKNQVKAMDQATQDKLLTMIEKDNVIKGLIPLKKSYKSMNDLHNQDKLWMGVMALFREGIDPSGVYPVDFKPSSINVKNRLEKSFYGSITLNNENILYQFGGKGYEEGVSSDKTLAYIFENAGFYRRATWEEGGHEGGGGGGISSELNITVDAKIKGNEYEITLVKLIDYCGDDTCGSMRGYFDRIIKGTSRTNNTGQIISLSNEKWEQMNTGIGTEEYYKGLLMNEFNSKRDYYINKMAKYKYTFVKVDGNFLLKSYEFIG